MAIDPAHATSITNCPFAWQNEDRRHPLLRSADGELSNPGKT